MIFRGIAVNMSETPYGKQPSFSRLDPKYFYPQNFPSVVVGHVLDPEPDDHILDMCAAPGINFYLLDESKSYIYICTFLTIAGTSVFISNIHSKLLYKVT